MSAIAATTTPATTSSQKWLPVAITLNQTQAGQSSQIAFAKRRSADREEHETDDQRVRRVQARHRRVRIGGELDQPAAVIELAEVRERVVEAEVREHPRRRRRQQDIADEADHVREQDRVAEAREGLVPAQVDPEEREAERR